MKPRDPSGVSYARNLTAIIFAALAFTALAQNLVRLPDVRKQDEAEARKELARGRFVVDVEYRRTGARPGTVIDMRPGPGMVKPGTKVQLLVEEPRGVKTPGASRPTAPVTAPSVTPPKVDKPVAQAKVPRIVGLTEARAKEELASYGMTGERRHTQETAVHPSDIVSGQDPAPDGTPYAAQDGRRIVFMRVTQSVPVPRVVDLNVSSAKERLKEVGLEVVAEKREPGFGIPNTVISQTPREGAREVRDRRAELVLSDPIFVPKLTDMTLAQAQAILYGSPLVAVERRRETRDYAPGTVFQQSPQERERAQRKEVELVVAVAAPIQTPTPAAPMTTAPSSPTAAPVTQVPATPAPATSPSFVQTPVTQETSAPAAQTPEQARPSSVAEAPALTPAATPTPVTATPGTSTTVAQIPTTPTPVTTVTSTATSRPDRSEELYKMGAGIALLLLPFAIWLMVLKAGKTPSDPGRRSGQQPDQPSEAATKVTVDMKVPGLRTSIAAKGRPVSWSVSIRLTSDSGRQSLDPPPEIRERK